MCRDDTKENRLRFLSVSLDKLKMACNIYAILFSSVVAQKKKRKGIRIGMNRELDKVQWPPGMYILAGQWPLPLVCICIPYMGRELPCRCVFSFQFNNFNFLFLYFFFFHFKSLARIHLVSSKTPYHTFQISHLCEVDDGGSFFPSCQPSSMIAVRSLWESL